MAQYRIAGLDLSTRMQITVEMVLSAHERGWGRASQLAQDYGVSRTLLYEWRHKAMQSLQETLQPHDPRPVRSNKAWTSVPVSSSGPWRCGRC
ncbi:MAG: hypothetical protein HS114_16650 [Anaerolineales bacterium]|nr:hypothetical protein [Anaerolineales bacterium]